MKDNVLVLMSTYNGEKYLKQQLDSIINQKDIKVNILVRDDGSTDGTKIILDEYKKKYMLDWYDGDNLKPANSFLNLIYNCKNEYDYYAFSDQDDFWKENKLIEAIKKIEQYNALNNIMYFSEKEIVNENLETLLVKDNIKVNTFECSLVRNIATGCTIVINNTFLKTLKKHKTYNTFCMHDSWIYRVCLAIDGIAIYDYSYKGIKYRQHNNNVLGANEKLYSRIIRRYSSIFKKKHLRQNTSRKLLKDYYELINDDKKKVLLDIINYRKSLKSKYRIMLSNSFKTESIKTNLIFKLCILFNIL